MEFAKPTASNIFRQLVNKITNNWIFWKTFTEHKFISFIKFFNFLYLLFSKWGCFVKMSLFVRICFLFGGHFLSCLFQGSYFVWIHFCWFSKFLSNTESLIMSIVSINNEFIKVKLINVNQYIIKMNCSLHYSVIAFTQL